jgi:hypothetical protein
MCNIHGEGDLPELRDMGIQGATTCMANFFRNANPVFPESATLHYFSRKRNEAYYFYVEATPHLL